MSYPNASSRCSAQIARRLSKDRTDAVPILKALVDCREFGLFRPLRGASGHLREGGKNGQWHCRRAPDDSLDLKLRQTATAGAIKLGERSYRTRRERKSSYRPLDEPRPHRRIRPNRCASSTRSRTEEGSKPISRKLRCPLPHNRYNWRRRAHARFLALYPKSDREQLLSCCKTSTSHDGSPRLNLTDRNTRR